MARYVPFLDLVLDEAFDVVVFGPLFSRHWWIKISHQCYQRQECLSTSADRLIGTTIVESEDIDGVDCSFCFVATGLPVVAVTSSQ